MESTRADRILEDWSAIADQARRPSAAPRRVAVRSGVSSGTLAGAMLLSVAILVAVVWFGPPGPDGGVGTIPSASPSPSASPAATPTLTPTPAPTATSSPTPTPTPVATAIPVATSGRCDPGDLAARITMWEGAAGHRIAHLELANNTAAACEVDAMAKPQLVNGAGTILIDGSDPTDSKVLTLAAGEVVSTLVQAGNYCGPAPVPPVSVAFVLRDGGRVVASPVSPTDGTVPPCLGSAGSAGDIEMHPWSR